MDLRRRGGRIRDKETALLARGLLDYTPSAHCPGRVSAMAMAQWGVEQAASMRAEYIGREIWDPLRR